MIVTRICYQYLFRLYSLDNPQSPGVKKKYKHQNKCKTHTGKLNFFYILLCFNRTLSIPSFTSALVLNELQINLRE